MPMPRTPMAARTSRWLIPPSPNFPISPWTICCIPLKRAARPWMSSSPPSVSASFWPRADGYGDAYGRVLALCETGASKAAIEEALAGHPALSFPKRIYPGYFISKLETVDGISWDGAWRTTEAGQRMRALLA